MSFTDRSDAGRRLAGRLASLRGTDIVVLGLPRGGVPVAFEIADALRAPLDVIVVRKLGVPYQPELAFGAIGEGGVRVLNNDVVVVSGMTAREMAAVERRERAELGARVRQFRGDRPPVSPAGRTALIVDDGVATGATARAACQVARAQGAARVVLAVPVAARDSVDALRAEVDDLICLETPKPFYGVGMWYGDFGQTTDAEVVDLLRRASAGVSGPSPGAAADPPLRDEDVVLAVDPATRLAGRLTIPENPAGMVVFAHGSGSSRHSPRNRYVAGVLNGAGLGTLLFDLLTPNEELDRARVFDIELLAGRLTVATRRLTAQPDLARLPIGYFGASTGAAAALLAAAEPDARIGAVVSRGGRPDLAAAALAGVRAPTLLIVGGDDSVVLELNRAAQAAMRCRCEVAVVPGATHLFSEPGTLEQAAALACRWFTTHLPADG